MAAVVKQLKDNDTGDKIYPVTNVNAVFNNDGDSLQDLLDEAGGLFVVNVTMSNGTYTADKTFAEVKEAALRGKEVVLVSGDARMTMQTQMTEYSGSAYFYYYEPESTVLGGMTLGTSEGNDYVDSWGELHVQSFLTFDNTPTANSTNPVKSGGIKTALDGKRNAPYNIVYSIEQEGSVQYQGLTRAQINDIYTAYNQGKEFYLKDPNRGKVWEVQVEHNAPYITISIGPIKRINSNGSIGSHEEWTLSAQAQSSESSSTFYRFNKTTLPTNLKTVAGQSLLGSGNIEVNSTVVANLTVNNDRIVSDLTCADLEAAYTSGKDVKVRFEDYEYSVQCYVHGGSPIFYFTVSEGDAYSIKNIEVYEDNTIIAQEFPYQQPLVSGTNIKTVNNNSLLGSGDVQVGDITGEELETEIEELESTLLTDALRKSEQVLLPAEKTQVLTNLGIADVVTQGNLKTVNSASLVGTGNIEIVSTNVGDVTIEQGIGDSQTTVMSQKAVSEQVERLTPNDLGSLEDLTRERRLPYGYDELDWIHNGAAGSGGVIDTGLIPDDANWVFEGSFYIVGNASANYAGFIAAYSSDAANSYRIIRGGSNNDALFVNAHSKSSGGASNITNIRQQKWYDFELKRGSLILNGTSYALSTTTGTTLTSTMKLGGANYPVRLGEFKAYHNEVLVADLVPCKHGEDVGMYDIVRGQFFASTNANNFIAGDFASVGENRLVTGGTLAEVIVQESGSSNVKLMSQNAVTSFVSITAERISGALKAAMQLGINLKLPSGYTEVEWLGNDNGAGYLITDFIPTLTSTVTIGRYMRTATGSTQNPIVLRAHSGNGVRNLLMQYAGSSRSQMYVQSFGHPSQTISSLDSSLNNWFDFELRFGKFTFNGVSSSLATNTTNTYQNTQSFRFFSGDGAEHYHFGPILMYDSTGAKLCLIPCIDSNDVVGMYDVVNGVFYHESSNEIAYNAGPILNIPSSDKLVPVDTISELVAQEFGSSRDKVVSQKVVTDEFEVVRYDNKIPTCFTGRLANFKFSDFPLFNPKDCEGISVMWSCSGTIGFINYIYSLFPSSINPNANNFSIAFRNGMRMGLMTSYAGTMVQGLTPDTTYKTHNVVTFNFKTGEGKVYGNGKLVYTGTVSNYDASMVATYLETATQTTLNTQLETKGILKHLGIAVFGHVLTDEEVTEIFGGGDEPIRKELVPTKYEANQLAPLISTTWDVFLDYGTKEAAEGGGYILTATTATNGLILFGFTGITGLRNNCIYEWDFEVVEGTGKDIGGNSRKMQYSQATYNVFTIKDSQGNDVTHSDLVQGEIYHVVCKPDNIRAARINAYSLCLVYYLYGTSGYKIKIHPTLKVQERGAALVCCNKNYRGSYWEQINGYQIPTTDFSLHESGKMKVYYDTYIPNVRTYSSSAGVGYNGQTAIDATNGKIYMGYYNNNGTGTWKQINNS